MKNIHIITPSYNQGAFIGDTLKSLLEVQSKPLKVYVIDGGSQDSTMNVVSQYSSKCDYVVSEKDSGQTEAINKGFAKIQAHDLDYINWINSDDLVKPNLAERLQKICGLIDHPIVISGRCENIDANGNFLNLRKSFLGNISSLYEALRNVDYCQPSTFYRYDVYKKLQPLPEEIHFCMDYVLWLRFLFLYGFNYIAKSNDIVLSSFRLHEEAKSGAARNSGFEKETLYIFKNFGKFVESYREDAGILWFIRVTYFKIILSLNIQTWIKKGHYPNFNSFFAALSSSHFLVQPLLIFRWCSWKARKILKEKSGIKKT